jgi:hypothetical protein
MSAINCAKCSIELLKDSMFCHRCGVKVVIKPISLNDILKIQLEMCYLIYDQSSVANQEMKLSDIINPKTPRADNIFNYVSTYENGRSYDRWSIGLALPNIQINPPGIDYINYSDADKRIATLFHTQRNNLIYNRYVPSTLKHPIYKLYNVRHSLRMCYTDWDLCGPESFNDTLIGIIENRIVQPICGQMIVGKTNHNLFHMRSELMNNKICAADGDLIEREKYLAQPLIIELKNISSRQLDDAYAQRIFDDCPEKYMSPGKGGRAWPNIEIAKAQILGMRKLLEKYEEIQMTLNRTLDMITCDLYYSSRRKQIMQLEDLIVLIQPISNDRDIKFEENCKLLNIRGILKVFILNEALEDMIEMAHFIKKMNDIDAVFPRRRGIGPVGGIDPFA